MKTITTYEDLVQDLIDNKITIFPAGCYVIK